MRGTDHVVEPPGRAVRRGRLSPAVLGWLVIAASLLVIGVAAGHTADLGPDPSWAFDCDDTTCTDLWGSARRHNANVAVVACVGVVLGWMLVGIAVPRRRAGNRRRWAWAVAFWTALLLVADTVIVIGSLTFMFSGVPAAVFFIAGGGVLQGMCLWRIIVNRSGGRHGRLAWWIAGGAVCAAVAAWMVLVVFLFPAVFVLSPLVAGPVLPVVQWSVLVQTRRAIRGEERPTSDVAAALDSPAREYRLPVLLWVPALLALAGTTAWACERVHAPPAGAREAPHRDATPLAPTPVPGSLPAGGVTPAAPSATTSRMVAAEPGLTNCTPAQLRLTVEEFDGVTGNSSAEIHAINVSGRRCALHGRPGLTLQQGGQAISLAVRPLDDDQPAPPPQGIALGPGMRASARLAWPGYRNAADQTTPQSVSIVLGAAGTANDVRLEGAPTDGHVAERAPAPFDIKAGVPGGAVLSIGRWCSP